MTRDPRNKSSYRSGPMGRTVELRIAGQNYRVVSSATAEQLERLARMVNQKMSELAPQARADGAHRLLLVALALANDVEEQREQHESLRNRFREFLGRILGRVDSALASPLLLDAEQRGHDGAECPEKDRFT